MRLAFQLLRLVTFHSNAFCVFSHADSAVLFTPRRAKENAEQMLRRRSNRSRWESLNVFFGSRRRRRTPRRRTPRVTPAMESLEDRTLLSVATLTVESQALAEPHEFCEYAPTPTFEVDASGVAHVGGTHGNDVITAAVNAQNVLVVNVNEYTFTVSNSLVTGLDIDAKCGNDLVSVLSSVEHGTSITLGNGNDTAYALGGPATVTGDAGNDFIVGGNNADTIHGGKGNDIILSGAGNDTVFGGAGDDRIAGGDGSDILHGGGGNDIILGDGPNSWPIPTSADQAAFESDLMRLSDTGFGHDFITGGDGADSIYSGRGNDLVLSGAGNDLVYGAAGADILVGGSGDDTINSGLGADVVLGDGPDTYPTIDPSAVTDASDLLIRAAGVGEGNDYIEAKDGNDWVHGGAGDDIIFGGAGDDTLYGGAGNDIIVGGGGHDTIFAGDGNDWAFGDGPNMFPSVLPGRDELIAYILRFANVNEGNDTIDGGAGNDLILAGRGNDRVTGGPGDDIILGGGGADWIEGGDGNDIIHGGADADVIFGGAGDDILIGARGDDYLIGGSGDDQLSGGLGDDWLFGDGTDGYPPGYVDPVEYAREFGTHGSGNDRIHGGLGHDVIFGGGGNDGIVADPPPVTLGPRPIDPVEIDPATTLDSEVVALVRAQEVDVEPVPAPRVGHDIVFGGAGNDRILGLGGNDILVGGGGNDRISGGAGSDLILGDGPNGVPAVLPWQVKNVRAYLHRVSSLERGNDSIDAGSGNDLVYGGSGNDLVYGGRGNDTVFGGAGDDRIAGGAGNDKIFGGEGDDEITGGSGQDYLEGGAGADTIDAIDGEVDVIKFDEFDILFIEGFDILIPC